MRIHGIVDARGEVFAFEVEKLLVSMRDVVNVLGSTSGVEHVEQRRPFSSRAQPLATFRFTGRAFEVMEPFGDNSRFWIGPSDAEKDTVPLYVVTEAFERHKPPAWRSILAAVLTPTVRAPCKEAL